MMPTASANDDLFDSLLGDFLDESAQLLERLNANLLLLDEWTRSCGGGRFDLGLINEMFRAAHSIKGLSAMLGLREINDLTHKIENIFDAARNDQLLFDPGSVELLFRGYDCLVGLIDAVRDPSADLIETAVVLDAISALLDGAGATRAHADQAAAERALAELTAAKAAVSAPTTIPPTGPSPAVERATENLPQPPVIPAPQTDGATDDIDLFAGQVDESNTPAKYLAIFIDEGELSLDQLTETLLNSEADLAVRGAEEALIISHRIKGSAAAIGLHRPAKLAHLMEDLLEWMRSRKQPLSPEIADLLLRCTDALRGYVQGLRTGQPVDEGFNVLGNQLLRVKEGKPATAPAASSTESPALATAPCTVGESREAFVARASRLTPPGQAAHIGEVRFESKLLLSSLKAQLIVEKLHRLGNLFWCEPTADEIESADEVALVRFAIASNTPIADLQQAVQVGGVAEFWCVTMPTTAEASAELIAPSPPVAPVAPVERRDFVERRQLVDRRAEPTAATANPVETAASNGVSSKAPAAEAAKPTETLRVDIERLDQLMNLAGQLVINKARFSRIGESLRWIASGTRATQQLATAMTRLEQWIEHAEQTEHRAAGGMLADHTAREARRILTDLEGVRGAIDSLASARQSVGDFLEAVHQLDRVADGIQKCIMDTRMVPIGPLFGRFRRVIRDITRSHAKEIQLEILGEKTELDKRMIDELGDPLIHMVRNSADHGIESPDVRRAAGKSPMGKVTLNAFHRGNHIVIQVSDDGRGLDCERIRKKAVEKGLLGAADAERLTPHQVYQLIWEPGFSTAEQVTEISGRGMGMDIVKSKIEGINGTVELDSRPGHGTTFTIKLPLTLAILPSLMVEIDGDVFAMPMESVVEIVRAGGKEICNVHGQRAARVRGRVVSIVDLNELLAWSTPAPQPRNRQSDLTVVVLSHEGQEVGLTVDRVQGEEDIVIKSLAENYRNLLGIAGASILGDGRVSLILDVAALIARVARASSTPSN